MKQNFLCSWGEQMETRWNVKKSIALGVLLAMCSLSINMKLIEPAFAAGNGAVVINEVAWAGSADSANDEWIELYNTTNAPINLANWYIRDNGSTKYTILSGTIPAHGYFLIEDHESAVHSVTSDAVIGLSLANGGESLELFNAADQLMDTLNMEKAAWPAGNATTKATLERINALSSGDVAENWASSTGSGDTASGGSAIVGTPKKVNSAVSSTSTGSSSGTSVDMVLSPPQPALGDTLTVTVRAQNVSDLFAYGFEISYDPGVLDFISASKADFLSQNNAIQTSFQANLENDSEGKIIVAEARTIDPKTGVSGSGNLATLTFNVIAPTANNVLDFGGTSFLADTTGDISASFQDANLSAPASLGNVTNLQITEHASSRYALQLSWDSSSSGSSYRVMRKDAHGEWKLLGETTQLEFIDQDTIPNGGFLVPQINYVYRVVAFQGEQVSNPAEAAQKETRGLKGDNNRSDKVDGRDLEQLARHFAEVDTDSSFNPLIDTTYDGVINGSDLIDIGANFALTYP